MWLFWVIGKEVRKYTESPGFAPRVEMPFSRTTAKRVPAGTLMGCDGPALGPAACTDRGAGGGADVCGPSGSCDRATPEVVPLINNAADRRTSVRLRCMAFSVLFLRCLRQNYGCLPQYTRLRWRKRTPKITAGFFGPGRLGRWLGKTAIRGNGVPAGIPAPRREFDRRISRSYAGSR